jgi:plasmid replication initiation protein
VLEPSIKQINEHTDIIVSVEQHKTGRSVTGFSFRFKQKPQPKVEQKSTLNEIQTHLISLSK